MAKQLKYITNIVTGQPVEAPHVSQSVEAFSAESGVQKAYDISVSGSFKVTGSQFIEPNMLLPQPQIHVLAFDDDSGQIFKMLTSSIQDNINEVYRTGSNDTNIIPNKFGTFDNTGTNSAIASGNNNKIDSNCSFIGGGLSNQVTSTGILTSIVGGTLNTASGTCSFIGGGNNNTVNGQRSSVVGGNNNTVNGQRSSVVGGLSNTLNGSFTLIGGGVENTISTYSNYSLIGGGCCNLILSIDTNSCATHTSIVGGLLNTASGTCSFIGGGNNNTVTSTSTNSSVVGGQLNTVSGYYNFIGSGHSNTISGKYSIDSFIGSGGNNSISFSNGEKNFIGGGANNTISGYYCNVIVGGSINLITGGCSFIGGGNNNTVNGQRSSVVGGSSNTASASCTFIGGGASNIAGGNNSIVVGGSSNSASAALSTIVGGTLNTASGACSFIGGGKQNEVGGENSSIVGGFLNSSSAEYSFIGGGTRNTSSANCSFIGGGERNYVEGCAGIIVGGILNTASGVCSFVGGGDRNQTNGSRSSVVGGFSNQVTSTGNFTSIVGGEQNTASAALSFIGNGCKNETANGASNSSVVGGRENKVCSGAVCSFIGGGQCNVIESNSDLSTIGGGSTNTVNGEYVFIGGGRNNKACADHSSVVGGDGNCSCANCSFVGGGSSNQTNGINSSVVGGFNNTASAEFSAIVGGACNHIQSTHCRSFIVGSNLTSDKACYTFMNNLDVAGIVSGSTFSGSFIGDGSGLTNVNSGNQVYKTGSRVSAIIPSKFGGNINNGTNASISSGCNNNMVTTTNSAIVSGCNNSITALDTNIIGGGFGNCINTKCSFIGAGQCNSIIGLTANRSGIVSGTCNIISSSQNSFIGAGVSNNITSSTSPFSSIVGGGSNTTNQCYSFIGGGCKNLIDGRYTSIVGGLENTSSAEARCSFIGGGYRNMASGSNSTIGGGCNNTSSGAFSAILGGRCNQSTSNCSFVGGGKSNKALAPVSTIVGGTSNVVSAACAGILGGQNNCACQINSFIVGSNLTSDKACYTFMNNLDVAGTISGSTFSGSFTGDGSGLTNVNVNSGSWDGIFSGSAQITGSLGVTGSINATNFTGSSFTGSFVGDGSGLTNLPNTTSGNQVYQTGSRVSAIIPSKFGGNTNNGTNSSISSGCNNNMSSTTNSAIVSGCCNSITTRDTSIIGGGFENCIDAALSFIGGGNLNNILGLVSNKSGIVSGTNNEISSSQHSFIGGGQSNNITSSFSNNSSKFSSIVGGQNNTINKCNSFIGGGCKNLTDGIMSVVAGGLENTASASYTFIGGGCNNVISQGFSAILGGKENTLEHACSFILGTDITSHAIRTTHVNNLTVSGSGGVSTVTLKDLPAEQTPYYLSYNETTGQVSKQLTSSIATGGGGGGLTTTEVTNIAESVSSNYNYGANVQNFLKKAREYNSSRVYSKPPKTIVLGDSIIAYGDGSQEKSYAHYLREHFSSSLLLPTSSFEIHAFGGKSYETFIPFIEDIMVNNNPDLVILAEYEYPSSQEGLSEADNYVVINEFVIKMIQKHTSADIAISTWSVNESTAKIAYSGSVGEGGVGINDYQSETRYLQINYLRDLARDYNCELLDINQAGIDQIQATQTFPVLVNATWPHCYPLYSTAFTSESIKHFQSNHWTDNLNLVNPNTGKEELITMKMGYTMDKFSERNISFSGARAPSGQFNSAVGTYEVRDGSAIIVDLTGSIGFELYYAQQAYDTAVDIQELFLLELCNDGGTNYQQPSALTFNGYPLEYATSIRELPFNDNETKWSNRRVFKKAVVQSSLSGSILAAGTGSSAQYSIEIRETGSIQGIPDLNTVILSGSYESYFEIMSQFKIAGSTDTSNNGTYTTNTVTYSGTPDITTITFTPSLNSTTVSGNIESKSTGSGTVDEFISNQDNVPLLLCDIKDPSNTVLATFVGGYQSASLYNDKVNFPLGYNGTKNYTIGTSTYDEADPGQNTPTPGDEFGFYFVSNWSDSIRPAITQSMDTSTVEVNTNPLYLGSTTEFLPPLIQYPAINIRSNVTNNNPPSADKVYLRVFGYEKSNWKLKVSANSEYAGSARKLRVLGVNNIKSKNL